MNVMPHSNYPKANTRLQRCDTTSLGEYLPTQCLQIQGQAVQRFEWLYPKDEETHVISCKI